MVTARGEAGGTGPTRVSVGQRFFRLTLLGMQRWTGGALILAGVVLLAGALLAAAQAPKPAPDSFLASPFTPRPSAGEPAPNPGGPPPAATATNPAAPRPAAPATKVWRPTRLPDPQMPPRAPGQERDLPPSRIRIPALGIDRRPVPLGVLDDGSLEAPHRYFDVGWWKDGPPPGSPGNAVVVGHVDSMTGPAVFYGLASLQRGDQVTVTRRDATAVQFRVRSATRFPVKDFPARRVYRRDGPPGLVLITCGGKYDQAAGRYLDNVVVFAVQGRTPGRNW